MIYHSNNISSFKKKALQWASSFNVCCYLDANSFTDKYSKFETLIAAGIKAELHADVGNAFERLQHFKNTYPNQWLTGFLTYELKDELENTRSQNPDSLKFPALYFFIPEVLISIKGNEIEISAPNADEIFLAIEASNLKEDKATKFIEIKSRLSKNEYIEKVNQIKDHIAHGDIYVTNFCQEFYAADVVINTLDAFNALNKISPNPFACFFKHHRQYILCASPERFLAKRDDKLISQPIKGTARRGKDEAEDNLIKQNLRANSKEQQENVMVVDMVRNDLTRCATPGSVEVEELFGLYSFDHVHQMISTVVCNLDKSLTSIDALKATFPMGSMTGAPKISAMRLMEQLEVSKRGIYSGAIGYFSPDGDFDFNVVIRSMVYNQEEKYLSFHAGSAITFDADAVAEYDECLLKTRAILQVLQAR